MDARTGTGKVIAEAAAPKAAVQLPLLGGPGAEPVEAEPTERRGRGRPAGAENRSTRELRAFLTSQFRHPLVTLARIQAQDPVDLARSLGCKPLEALDRIKSAAADLAPYLTGKMPVEDANGNAVLPILQLVDPRLALAGYGAEAVGPVLDVASLEVADFRHSGDAAEGTVGQPELDGADEGQENRASQDGEQLIEDQP